MNQHFTLPSYISERRLPVNISQEDIGLFSADLRREIPQSKIQILKNVVLVEDTIWEWKTLQIKDELTHPLRLGWKAKLRRVAKIPFQSKKISKAIWASDYWAHNYFHWVTESLTRLVCLNGQFKDHIVVLPEELKNYSYVSYTLDLLGYNFTYLNKNSRIRVNQLVSFERTAPSFNYHRDALLLLRERIRQKFGHYTATRKIYISRSKATKRKIVNEADLFPILEDHGYEIHHFESYLPFQQIDLMCQASHLVSIHGAGLTNMIYMGMNAKVFEFRFRGDSSNNCFFTLASELEFDYYYTQNEFENPKIHLNSNMILDISQVSAILKAMDR